MTSKLPIGNSGTREVFEADFNFSLLSISLKSTIALKRFIVPMMERTTGNSALLSILFKLTTDKLSLIISENHGYQTTVKKVEKIIRMLRKTWSQF